MRLSKQYHLILGGQDENKNCLDSILLLDVYHMNQLKEIGKMTQAMHSVIAGSIEISPNMFQLSVIGGTFQTRYTHTDDLSSLIYGAVTDGSQYTIDIWEYEQERVMLAAWYLQSAKAEDNQSIHADNKNLATCIAFDNFPKELFAEIMSYVRPWHPKAYMLLTQMSKGNDSTSNDSSENTPCLRQVIQMQRATNMLKKSLVAHDTDSGTNKEAKKSKSKK